MPRKPLTHEEFMEKFYVKNKNAENIEILGKYTNTRTKIKCKCKIDGHEWEATPGNLLRNHGCPICGGTIKKNHEEFINELNKINDNIEIIGEYINNRTKIKCKCKIDGYEWETKPNDLLNSHGCPICGEKLRRKNKTKTHEYFILELNKINDNIEIIELKSNVNVK